MRTTVTLDPDVEHLLKDAAHAQRQSFKVILNDAVRRSLGTKPAARKPAQALRRSGTSDGSSPRHRSGAAYRTGRRNRDRRLPCHSQTAPGEDPVILPDANLLLYAYDAGSPFHDKSAVWWSKCLSGSEPVGFCPGSPLRFYQDRDQRQGLRPPPNHSRGFGARSELAGTAPRPTARNAASGYSSRTGVIGQGGHRWKLDNRCADRRRVA